MPLMQPGLLNETSNKTRSIECLQACNPFLGNLPSSEYTADMGACLLANPFEVAAALQGH